MEVLDWNIAPNQRWVVKLIDAGAAVDVELYNSADNALAGTNRVAYATGQALGADVKVILIADAAPPLYGGALAKFNTALDYHLRFSAAPGDPSKKFEIGPFTDLEAVEDALMLTEQVIRDRAIYEINKGTHSRVTRALRTAGHNPTLNVGDCVTVTLSKRGITAIRHRVTAITLEISIDEAHEVQFFDQLELVQFENFSRT